MKERSWIRLVGGTLALVLFVVPVVLYCTDVYYAMLVQRQWVNPLELLSWKYHRILMNPLIGLGVLVGSPVLFYYAKKKPEQFWGKLRKQDLLKMVFLLPPLLAVAKYVGTH